MTAPDRQAFEAFFHRYVGEVLTAVARRVADPPLIADLVAEVFQTVQDGLEPRRPGGSARARLARTVAVLAAGHSYRTLTAPSAPRLSGRLLLTEADAAELRSLAVRESGHRALASAIGRRPARHRILLELAILDGLPPDEIAAVLGVRPSRVRRRLRRERGLEPAPPPASAVLPDFTARLLRALVSG